MKHKRNGLVIISIILCMAGLTGIVLFLWQVQKSLEGFKQVKEGIGEEKKDNGGLEYYIVDGQVVQKKFYDLYRKNKDFIGWITIKDTPVDYPVMHNFEQEDKYLHRNFNGEYDFSGCIFASAASDINYPSDNILLYGHHMNTNIMFSPIMKYESQDFLEQHKYIQFDTLRENALYEVIAAFRTQIYPDEYDGFVYYHFTDAYSQEEFDDYITHVKEMSEISVDTSAQYGDKLLSLSTCAYHVKNGRFVVVAKKIEAETVLEENAPIQVIQDN